jgi:hypothetical protein
VLQFPAEAAITAIPGWLAKRRGNLQKTFLSAGATHEVEAQKLAAAIGPEVASEVLPDFPDVVMAAWARPVELATKWDLRAGDGGKSRPSTSLRRAWQKCRSIAMTSTMLAAGVAFCAVQVAGLNLLAWQAKARQDSLVQQQVQLVQQVMGAGVPVVDPPRQLQQAVARLRLASGQPSAHDVDSLLTVVTSADLVPMGTSIVSLDYSRDRSTIRVTPPLDVNVTKVAEDALRRAGWQPAVAGDTVTLEALR